MGTLAAMAPKRKAEEVEIDIRGQLAQILGKSVANVGHVRKTEEDLPRISVIDVARGITGKNADGASKDIRIMVTRYPEVRKKLPDFKFPGRGQRDTHVTDLSTIIEIIFILPGRRKMTWMIVRRHVTGVSRCLRPGNL